MSHKMKNIKKTFRGISSFKCLLNKKSTPNLANSLVIAFKTLHSYCMALPQEPYIAEQSEQFKYTKSQKVHRVTKIKASNH